RAPERRLADDVAELRSAARVQVAPVREQEVELPLRAQRAAEVRDRLPQSPPLLRVAVREGGPQLLDHPAERVLAVGLADRVLDAQSPPLDVGQRAVVREREVTPPQHALEGMRVVQRRAPSRLP